MVPGPGALIGLLRVLRQTGHRPQHGRLARDSTRRGALEPASKIVGCQPAAGSPLPPSVRPPEMNPEPLQHASKIESAR